MQLLEHLLLPGVTPRAAAAAAAAAADTQTHRAAAAVCLQHLFTTAAAGAKTAAGGGASSWGVHGGVNAVMQAQFCQGPGHVGQLARLSKLQQGL